MSEATIDFGTEFDFGPHEPEFAADGEIRTELQTIALDEPCSFDAGDNSNPVTKMFAHLVTNTEGTHTLHDGHFAGTQPDQVAIITQSSGDAMLYVKPQVSSRNPKPAVAYHLQRDAAGIYTLAARMLAEDLSEVSLRPDHGIVYGWAAKETNQSTIVTKEGGVLHEFYKTMQSSADAGRKRGLGRFFVRR